MSVDDRRHVDWTRFAGVFANASVSDLPGRGPATLGVAGDVCDCCDERYVVIAAVHPAGVEVSVALSPAEALKVANAILDAYAKVSSATAGEGVRQ